MVSNKCFVPGCKTGYDSDKKKRKARGERYLSLFTAPREEDKLKKWRRAIPRLDREMSSKDKVCEIHFLPEEITRVYVIKLSDGTERVLGSKKPALSPDAVPSIFPTLPSYFTTLKKPRKPPCVRLPLVKKARKSSKTEKVLTMDERLNNFSFGELLRNVDEVLKPNKSWSVSSHGDFVVCVKWDKTFAPERQVIISSNLCVKVRYYGIEVKATSDNVVQSVEHLSALLGKINGHLICSGIKHGNENCSVIVERQLTSRGRPQTWCPTCKEKNSKSPLKQEKWDPYFDENTSSSINTLPIEIKDEIFV